MSEPVPVPRDPRACPECGAQSLYQTTATFRDGHGRFLLPGLGTLFRSAEVQIRVCADCGLTRSYAMPDARAKLRTSVRWQPL